MALKPVPIDRFPGLDLRQDVSEWPGAVDCLNIDFEPGRIKTRAGSRLFYLSTLDVFFMFAKESTLGSYIIALTKTPSVNPPCYVLSTAGVLLGSTTFPLGGDAYSSAAAIGTPTATYVYVQSASLIRRWDGATWTTPAGMPTDPTIISVSPTDNRLVVCATVAGNNTRTWFSDPGAPETFGANNYVDLRPGDGEEIRAAAVFNNQTFLFKRSKYFVFYGNSTDSTGEPVFNYRTVEGVGVGPDHAQAVCVGDDAVYFLGHDGIYRTTGGVPQRISDPLRPFFTGKDQLSLWSGGTWDSTGIFQRLHWFEGILYATVSRTSGTAATVTYDPAVNAWSFLTLSAQTMASLVVSGDPGLFYGTATGILKVDPTLTADAGTPISSFYRSGFMDLGSPNAKRIRETLLEGTGTPTFQWSRDYGALTSGSTVTLGTSPATTRARQSLGLQGRRFSYKISANTGAWTLNYLQPNILAEQPVFAT